MKPTLFAVVLLAAFAALARSEDVRSPRALNYNRDVRPILSDKCFACHGPDATHREADLRLDDEASAKGDRGGYAAIVASNPEESELIRRITSDDEAERMPPPESGKDLTAAEIETLRRWIAEGAPWSKHWAYEAPRRWPLPPVKDSEWPLNEIDSFILARLEEEGLSPSPEADRVTLARRLHFDLTGLPPSPEDVAAFAADESPGAYERLADRLLASPALGERMAVYWLDVVRYADTVGYHGDQEHHASPYRDWVIDAFNSNMPFDQFTREQLAGDLLPDSGPDQKIASAYNRLLQTSHEGGVQAKEYLAIYGADRVRNLSLAWMGATMGCTQCHDHKFDPYTSKDFYALQAFFADVDEAQHLKKGADISPTVRPPEVKLLTRLERLKLEAAQRDAEQTREQIAASGADDQESVAALPEQLAALERRRDEIQNAARMVMISVPIEPRPIRILPRGNWLDDSGPLVQPAIPEFLGKLETGERRATRLDLANWLTNAEHGAGLLTARVFVNRIWALYFGNGLSRSLEDFGGQGESPSHPELLDRLAVEFVESGWDVKHVVRLIVTSRTYWQSSLVSPELQQADPENRLLARQSPWSLPAEMVRDNALSLSGLLTHEIGGASVRPYQPEGYYQYLNFPKRDYKVDTDDRQWRRGVYVHWQRTYLHPMLKAFDAPSREECTAHRSQSNTPLASLVLLNDPTFIEAARVFASLILREGGQSTADRLEFAWRRALSRSPDEFERAAMIRYLDDETQRYQREPEAAQRLMKVGIAPPPASDAVTETAAWTSVARIILNLSETLTRN
jgi:mono/diheme cytochrome c family protein